jgi:hypothetical protein
MISKEKIEKLFTLVGMEQKSLKFAEIILEKIMFDSSEDSGGILVPYCDVGECVREMKIGILKALEKIYMETYNDEEIDFLLEHLANPLKKRIEENEDKIHILLESALDAAYEKSKAKLNAKKLTGKFFDEPGTIQGKKADLITLASCLKTGNDSLPYDVMTADIRDAIERSEQGQGFDPDFVRTAVFSPLEFLKKRIGNKEWLEIFFRNNANAAKSTSRTSVYFAEKVLSGEIESQKAASLINEVEAYYESVFGAAGLTREVRISIC